MDSRYEYFLSLKERLPHLELIVKILTIYEIKAYLFMVYISDLIVHAKYTKH